MTGHSNRKLNKFTLHQELRGRGDLKSVHRDVLQALASYGDYNLAGIRVSVERVCKDYGLSENTVRAAISYCRKGGYLQLIKAGVGRSNPSEYVIVIPPENPPNSGGFSSEVIDVKPPKVCTENPQNFALKPPNLWVPTSL